MTQDRRLGGVMSAMAAVLADRDHDADAVIAALTAPLPGGGGIVADEIESDLWDDYFGPAADEIANRIGLPAYPDEA